jgi:hypothetical protein
MSNALISTALAGGLVLTLFGLVLLICAVHRSRSASAPLAAGLIMWAAGLYCAAPFIRIIAVGMLAILATVAVPLALATKSKKPGLAAAYLLLVVPAWTVPIFIARSIFSRLLDSQQSPALASASVWLATASVILIAVALAVPLALAPGRAQSSAS